MKTKIEIKSIFGNVLFEFKKESNSVKDTLIEAVKRDAYLRDANLYGADLRGAKNLIYPLSCPEIGSFIGFKKAHDGIVTLKITEDAKRSSATTRKCRCNKAEVIQIEGFDGKQLTQTCSAYDKSFIYRVGDVVEVDDFCEDRWDECSTGIHFFITKEEAVNF